MSAVIAYTMGSFWYCLDCVEELGQDDELSPTQPGDLIDDESYFCDSCGGAIRRLS